MPRLRRWSDDLLRVRYIDTEERGFPRDFFPLVWRSHELHLLHNDAHETADERLQLHLTIHCPRCDDENTVRGRLPPEYDSYDARAAIAKLIALGYFKNVCSGKSHHTYYGP